MRKTSHRTDHLSLRAQPPSRRRRAKVARDAAEQFSLLSNSSPREQCGTRSASAAASANVHSTRCWRAMVPIRRSIVNHATVDYSDQKASVMDTPRPCLLMANLQWTGFYLWRILVAKHKLKIFFSLLSVSSIGGARPSDGTGCPVRNIKSIKINWL